MGQLDSFLECPAMVNVRFPLLAHLGLLALGLFAPVMLTGCGSSSALPIEGSGPAAANEPSVVLTVKPAAKRSIGRTITALGRCEALPQKMAVVTPLIEGRVAEILSRQGDEVPAGQAIVQLDTTLAQADLAEKRAARESLIASLRALQSLPRSEEQRASKLAIDQAEIAVRRAQALVDRLQPLRQRNEVPEAQLFEANEALKQAQVQKQTSQAQLDQLMLGPRQEAVAEAQSRIDAADEAVKTAQTRMDLHTIRAPIAGILDSLDCRPGQTIAVGATIGSIIDDQEVLALAWLPVSRVQMARPGHRARVYSSLPPSHSETGGELPPAIEGRIVYAGRSADAQSGNVPIHVLVDNQDGKLVIGQTLALDITVDEPVVKLCVPLDAVHDEGDGPALTVVREGKAVVLHPQLGAPDAGWIEVSDTDLHEGEPVAVAGAYNLPDGTPVRTAIEK